MMDNVMRERENWLVTCQCAEKPACSEEAAGIAAPAELPGPTAVVAEGNQGCSTAKVLVGVPGGG